MNSQSLQRSVWSLTQTYSSHHQDLSKRTNENKIVSYDTRIVNDDQHFTNDQKNRRSKELIIYKVLKIYHLVILFQMEITKHIIKMLHIISTILLLSIIRCTHNWFGTGHCNCTLVNLFKDNIDFTT
jgi:hypothetical protein